MQKMIRRVLYIEEIFQLNEMVPKTLNSSDQLS